MHLTTNSCDLVGRILDSRELCVYTTNFSRRKLVRKCHANPFRSEIATAEYIIYFREVIFENSQYFFQKLRKTAKNRAKNCKYAGTLNRFYLFNRDSKNNFARDMTFLPVTLTRSL